MKLNCPACGAQVDFKSKFSVWAVCSFCSSTLVRGDLDVEAIGKMAELPEDVSPLQLGTRGQAGSAAFELVGRLRLSWAQGGWNEWYALFDDGRDGWVAEAQGQYYVLFSERETKGLPRRDQVFPDRGLRLPDGRSFTVADIKEVTCVGSEGELPFAGARGRKSVSVDLVGPKEEFATLDYSQEDGTLFFVGRRYEFDELKLTALRELEGW